MSAPPLIASCYFKAKKEPDGQYDRLARVLSYTASKYCPDWQQRIDAIEPVIPPPSSGNDSHAWNTSKLEWWTDVALNAENGTRLLLMDADMVILRSLRALWKLDFDLAYTIRDPETSHLPFNGGVIALRISDRTKAFMQQWRTVDGAFCRQGTVRGVPGFPQRPRAEGEQDRMRHSFWRRKYMGMNQASFGYLKDELGFEGMRVVSLPCQEWNCCEWLGFNEQTRIVHVKSRLRRAVFPGEHASPPTGNLAVLADLWHRIEAEMIATEVKSA